MFQRWQIAVVAVLLVAALLIDVQLFAILAGVAVAGVVFAEVHGRARARRNATAPLAAAVRTALALGDDDPPTTALQSVRIAGRPVRLAVDARPAGDGTLRGCLEVRAPIGRSVPFCFVGQRARAPVTLPPIVSNAAFFETRLECELQPVTPEPPSPDRPGAAAAPEGYDWASSSPGALQRLFDAGVRNALAALAGRDGATLAAVQFDGAAVRALLTPDDPRTEAWIRPAVEATVALAAAVEEGLVRVAQA